MQGFIVRLPSLDFSLKAMYNHEGFLCRIVAQYSRKLILTIMWKKNGLEKDVPLS